MNKEQKEIIKSKIKELKDRIKSLESLKIIAYNSVERLKKESFGYICSIEELEAQIRILSKDLGWTNLAAENALRRN